MLISWIVFLHYRNVYDNEYIRFRLDSLNELKRYIDLQFFNINFESSLLCFRVE